MQEGTATSSFSQLLFFLELEIFLVRHFVFNNINIQSKYVLKLEGLIASVTEGQ